MNKEFVSNKKFVNNKNLPQRGFSLMENVVAIVLLAVAMLLLTTVFYPNFQRTAEAQKQTQAISLAQSVMDLVLSRSFDENSDHSGDYIRCDGNDSDGNLITCSDQMGYDDEVAVADFDDVDDFNGCWYSTPEQQSLCQDIISSDSAFSTSNNWQGSLSDLLGTNIADKYQGFRVLINVTPFPDESQASYDASNLRMLKKVEISIAAFDSDEISARLIGLRGNY